MQIIHEEDLILQASYASFTVMLKIFEKFNARAKIPTSESILYKDIIGNFGVKTQNTLFTGITLSCLISVYIHAHVQGKKFHYTRAY